MRKRNRRKNTAKRKAKTEKQVMNQKYNSQLKNAEQSQPRLTNNIIHDDVKLISIRNLSINFVVFMILSILLTYLANKIPDTNLSMFLTAVANEQIALKTIY